MKKKDQSMKKPFRIRLRNDFKLNKYVYLMAVPVIIYYLIFAYFPMYGAQIAFRNFVPTKGIMGSKWVGWAHFNAFFSGPYAGRVIGNTLLISLYSILVGFPAPIVLALLLNEIKSVVFKRTIQTIVYLPHFISTVVICSLIRIFVAKTGIVTQIFAFFGGPQVNLLGYEQYFRTIFTASGVWQTVGWGSIIYLSAIAGIDQEQYEAAIVDGANRFQQAIYVTLPGLLPTIGTMFILRIGSVMSVGYEKIILLYNPNTYATADVISSYIYRVGLEEGFQLSYSTAVGLFTSLVNLILVILANTVNKKTTEMSLW